MPATIHLHPTAPLADRVLLPGDPGRALILAQALLSEPKMFNHNRGLWGYTGTSVDGESMSIQSTGMGGPSAAIVISELVELGARRLLRVGTCGALSADLALGDLLVATDAIVADGTSQALGAGERVGAVGRLTETLTRCEGVNRAGPIVTTDLFYDARRQELEWHRAGALAVDMETATLFALALRLDVQAASLLIVSDLLVPERLRIEPEVLRESELLLGQIAAAALARP
ncbi:MAG: phosphorylase family protein [Solirubrobacteraceae bacterium]